MKCTRSERINSKVKKQHRSKIAYWTITLMHDNPLLGLLKDPVRKLRSAGLEEGQKVLEVGCGPGFYTIPAARIVGSQGHVFALDLHPGFIEKVREKAKKEALCNITATECNASDTSIPAESMDLVFLFGLGHIAGGLDSLLLEMKRVLKRDGLLSFEGHGRAKPAIQNIEKAGFRFLQSRDRIMIFKRI